MFQSALYSKPPVLTSEEINIGIEKSFEELDKATAMVERLTLARESFNAIPAENMSQKLVTLFASNFVDVPSHLVPETSSKALESAQRASGKELKAFALESGDGVISKIIEFIKSVCRRIRDFFKSLFKKLSKPYTVEFSTDISSAFNAEITPTEDFAVFVKRGKLEVDTINDVVSSMSTIATNLLSVSNKIKTASKSFKTTPKDIESIFDNKEFPLNPDTDWPGQVKFSLNDDLEASLLFPETAAERPKSMDKLTISRLSMVESMSKSIEITRKGLASSIESIEEALAKIEKEADSLSQSRYVSSNPSSGDVNDVIDINTPREEEKSLMAMKMFMKIIGTFSKGVTGVSVRFLDHEAKAIESMVKQVNRKA